MFVINNARCDVILIITNLFLNYLSRKGEIRSLNPNKGRRYNGKNIKNRKTKIVYKTLCILLNIAQGDLIKPGLENKYLRYLT